MKNLRVDLDLEKEEVEEAIIKEVIGLGGEVLKTVRMRRTEVEAVQEGSIIIVGEEEEITKKKRSTCLI
jgi:hypothetical protein